jgi:serine protease AprX
MSHVEGERGARAWAQPGRAARAGPAEVEQTMLRSRARVVLVVSVLALQAALAPVHGGAAAGTLDVTSSAIDPLLAEQLATADADDELVAVATTSAVADPTLVAALELVGLEVTAYRELPIVGMVGTPSELTAAATVDGVERLWANTPLHSATAQTRVMTRAEQVHHDLGLTGDGVGIAILDSGIEATHPDLELGAKTVQNVKILGNQHVVEGVTVTVEDVPDTDTTTGHGTHVAGIAAGDGTASDGLYRGMAPGADLVGVGAADGIEMLTAIAGYDWILANHERYAIRVINNSWADGEIEYDPAHPLNVASRAAFDAGIVVVFAAGNGGQDGDAFNRYAWPDWVVSVGGVDKTGELGDYSSRGTTEHHADLVAPGTFIASTMATTGIVGVPNQSPFDFTDPLAPRVIAPEHAAYYTVKIGTSMAAPHVAGIVALMLEANPDLTPTEVRDLLMATAVPVPGCAEIDCGAGLVDARAAVEAALGTAAGEPPVAALVADPATGAAPLATTLDAGGSHDPDGEVVAYRWDLDGDGEVDRETDHPRLEHTYPAGVWRPTVAVVDDDGLVSAPVEVEVRASDPPTAAVDAPRHARSGVEVTFDASASHDPDGEIVSYRFVLGDGTEVVTTSSVITHTYATAHPVRLGWVVVVTDDAGLEDAVSGSLRVTPSGGSG